MQSRNDNLCRSWFIKARLHLVKVYACKTKNYEKKLITKEQLLLV